MKHSLCLLFPVWSNPVDSVKTETHEHSRTSLLINTWLQDIPELIYPFLTNCGCDVYNVVTFVFHHTKRAQQLLIRATVNLQTSVMTGADAFFGSGGGLDQVVLLQRRHVKVRLQMLLAVRGHAREAEHLGCSFSLCADVTPHISQWRSVSLKPCGEKFVSRVVTPSTKIYSLEDSQMHEQFFQTHSFQINILQKQMVKYRCTKHLLCMNQLDWMWLLKRSCGSRFTM